MCVVTSDGLNLASVLNYSKYFIFDVKIILSSKQCNKKILRSSNVCERLKSYIIQFESRSFKISNSMYM